MLRTMLALAALGGMVAYTAATEPDDDMRKAIVKKAKSTDWSEVPFKHGGNWEPNAEKEADKAKGIDSPHFVHSVYRQAGAPYPYMKIDDLVKSDKFAKVDEPKLGDLIVWPAYTETVKAKGKGKKDTVTHHDAHIGIVSDVKAKKFIGAQVSTSVKEIDYEDTSFMGKRKHEFYQMK